MTIEITEKELELIKAMCLNVRSNGNTVNPKPLEVDREMYVTACKLFSKVNATQ